MKRIVAITMCATLLSINVTFAASNYNFNSNGSQTYTGQPLRGHLVSVPAGSVVPVVTTREIGSESLTQGQRVDLAMGSDFYYDGQLIAPAGSIVTGTATVVKSANHGSTNGKLKITFTQITTPQGVQIPITGVIKTNDGTGLLVGGTKMDVTKEYAKDMAVGSAAGALSGVVFGALAGGSVGKGAALGTAVGAAGRVVQHTRVSGRVVRRQTEGRDRQADHGVLVHPRVHGVRF